MPPLSPTSKAIRRAIQIGIPAMKQTAATIPDKEAIDPTDRSKSFITITMVMVDATTINIDNC